MRSVLHLSLLLLSALQAPAQDSKKGLESLVRIPSATLEQLRSEPDEYLGLKLRFTVAFGEEKSIDNPYFTRFNAMNFIRFSARSIAKPLWEPEVYSKEFEHLFISKDSAYLSSLRLCKKNQRVQITGIVRDSFRSLPWIEILEIKLLEEWTPEGTLIAVARAKKLNSEGQGSLAIEEFRRALIDPLPVDQKVAILKEIAAIHLDKKENQKAKEVYLQASKLDPNDAELQEKVRS